MNATPSLNAIETRISTRTFQDTPLSPADLEKISAYLDDPENLIGPYGHKIEIELLTHVTQ